MEKRSYKLSQLAQEHLTKVKTYTVENFSQLQWDKYRVTLTSGLQMLAENPDLARSCSDIVPNGFYFPIGKHMR
ncbi:type II toxin-antitoxin system RelE/ParE family toxin [Shewanella sp. AS1]|uniref:type II toxin-antitoxin system RelE/ParE family toxin n=1 Tax=Shewanella sp. AS1 TaxID=2907626 RepID=UPI003FA37E4E